MAKISLAIILMALIAVTGLLIYNRYLVNSYENRYPAVGEFTTVADVNIHYLDSGKSAENSEKLTLVLLHGVSTSLLDFRHNLFESLSTHWRVIAFDRPGHGYSERPRRWTNPAQQAELIAATLRQLGVNDSVWIGHSWAGSVVLAGLIHHPQLIKAGVSLAGASHPWSGESAWHVKLASRPVLGKVFAYLLVPIVGRSALPSVIEDVLKPNPVPDNYMNQTGVLLSVRPSAFINSAIDRHYLSDWLEAQVEQYPTIEQSMLLLSASEDDIVPATNHARRLSSILPNASWKIVEGAGHALHHSHREQVDDEIQHFLRELGAG